MSEQETREEISKALDDIGAPYGETLSDRIRARGAAYARGSHSAMADIAFARKERDDALAALDKMTTRATGEEQRATRATAETNAVRDALNDANIPYADTPAKRIREFDAAMAAVVAERDEVIRQRGEALGRVAATVAGLDTAIAERDEFIRQRDEALRWQHAAVASERSAEKREAEAHAEIDALDRALSAAGLPTAETLAGRVAGLQMMRAEALSEARALVTERDNCREVLRKEREERAAEKATVGQVLAKLRADNSSLEAILVGLRKDNAKSLAQLDFAERIILAGLRG